MIIDFSLDIGIYEPEFTYKEMKELLGFINGSQDTSNVASNNKDTHKVCNYNYHIIYMILKYKMFYMTIITNLKFNYYVYVELIQERKESTLIAKYFRDNMLIINISRKLHLT